ncbi:hypothetical protein PCC9214_01885 [Planktothrix tepida]|uniref:Uncharacterized protein n=2 Tax=Planktothrix TaxID=54304 RepID=A0A1J1LMJ0_9CYAN|nr:hypothetical protein PCC9214_01885 [Planktothrix tepida]CAD5971068.1 hypothetical protein NO713_03825 [Planktothrix pseudagardhii]CUR33156.1 hypothetical protein PL9214500403 [Planktothrix tepida PCC 9214]
MIGIYRDWLIWDNGRDLSAFSSDNSCVITVENYKYYELKKRINKIESLRITKHFR